jgi:hypothetical protein
MAGRLNARHRRSIAVLAAIVLLVLLGHLLMGRTLADLRAGWGLEVALPPRLQAAFVREMKETAPPRPSPARPAPPEPARAAPRVAAAVAPPPEPPASAASAPELAEAAPEPAPAEPAAVAAVAAASPASAASEPGDEPGPEWPDSVQLDYRLSGYYRGDVSGDGRVQWLREGRHYQVHLEMRIGPEFAPLVERRMSSDGQLTARGIAPQRYDEVTRTLMRSPRQATVKFSAQPDGGTEVQLADGSKHLAAQAVQDASSQFVQLTWLFLTGRETLAPGRIVELPLALPRKLYAWRYQVIGEEKLETPMGTLNTWHLQPLLQSDEKLRDLKAEVWLAPTLQYLPVRLRVSQDEQTFIDLSLRAAPRMQASP